MKREHVIAGVVIAGAAGAAYLMLRRKQQAQAAAVAAPSVSPATMGEVLFKPGVVAPPVSSPVYSLGPVASTKTEAALVGAAPAAAPNPNRDLGNAVVAAVAGTDPRFKPLAENQTYIGASSIGAWVNKLYGVQPAQPSAGGTALPPPAPAPAPVAAPAPVVAPLPAGYASIERLRLKLGDI